MLHCVHLNIPKPADAQAWAPSGLGSGYTPEFSWIKIPFDFFRLGFLFWRGTRNLGWGDHWKPTAVQVHNYNILVSKTVVFGENFLQINYFEIVSESINFWCVILQTS